MRPHIAPDVLRKLLVPSGTRALWLTALLLTSSVGLGWLGWQLPLVVRMPVWIAAGFMVNGLVQLGHEAWHRNLFKSALANDFFGYWFSLLFLMPFGSARHAHLAHHRHNRTGRDPDAYNVGEKGLRVNAQFYVVAACGLLLAPLHFALLYPAVFMRGRALYRHVFEVLVSMLAVGLLLRGVLMPAHVLGVVAKVWLVPVLFASPWNGLKSIADHYANTWQGDRYHTATTVRTTRIWTFLWSGLNYHLDHHLYPRVPGYNLPKVHACLRAHLTQNDAPVFDGYFHVFARALKAGPTYVSDSHTFLTQRAKPDIR